MQVKMVLMLLLLVLIGLETTGSAAHSIGVCYGRVANNLPSAEEVIDLYKTYDIERMRIYDPDQATLEALRGSNIELVIGVRNEDIKSIANDVSSATIWVQNNVLKYSQDVKFRYIVVGNEIDPTNDATSQFVLLAMQNIYTTLASNNLQNQIKVSTAIQMGLLGSSYPPTQGAFSPSSISYITPIVKFLVESEAPLLANVYTYFSYISDPNNIDISFALFNPTNFKVNDGHVYHNLFDATLGAIYAALEKVGGANLEVVVSESGWPSDGGVAATVENSQMYYENLIKHVSSGTTNYRLGQPVETYLFAMFDENKKGPAETERHFGLFTPNKQIKYQISLKQSSSSRLRVGVKFSFGLALIISLLCF